MNKKLQVLKYVLADFIAAALAWMLFFIFRKYSLEPVVLDRLAEIFDDRNLYLGLVIVPLFWLLIYGIVGTYNISKIFRKSV